VVVTVVMATAIAVEMITIIIRETLIPLLLKVPEPVTTIITTVIVIAPLLIPMLVLAGQAHQHPGLVNKQATKKVLVLINENWLIPELFVFRDNMKYHHQRD